MVEDLEDKHICSVPKKGWARLVMLRVSEHTTQRRFLATVHLEYNYASKHGQVVFDVFWFKTSINL